MENASQRQGMNNDLNNDLSSSTEHFLYIHIHTWTYILKHIHMDTHIYIYTNTQKYMQIHTHMDKHTCTHT